MLGPGRQRESYWILRSFPSVSVGGERQTPRKIAWSSRRNFQHNPAPMSRAKRRIPKRPVPKPDQSERMIGKKVALPLLLTAVVIAYFPLFSNSFVDFDDPVYITGNAHIRSGLTLDTWNWAWTTWEAGNWHPLTWVSHALDVTLFGMNSVGHHLTSLLLHLVNVVLLYLLLSQVTQRKQCCLAASAIFALHPLAVESVAWAAERKNLLSTLFFLLAIGAYGWYCRRPGAGRYVAVALMFALGLCAKPMVITLPFVLLLLDYWPLGRAKGLGYSNRVLQLPQRSIGELVVEKIPLLGLSAASAIVTLVAQSSAGAIESTKGLPWGSRIANAIFTYMAYIRKAVWPVDLAPFYPWFHASGLQVAVALLFLGTVSFLVWRERLRRPYLIIGWLYYLGTLVPVIGLIQVGRQAMADRYTYIPLVGIFVAITWLADDLASLLKVPTATRAVLAAAVIIVLAALTRKQVELWHDDIKLWSYDLKVTSDNVVAEDNLGIALLQQERTEEALTHFYRASLLQPDDAISAVNVATDLLRQGRGREAIAKYQAALPGAAFVPMLLATTHSNLGSAFLSVGDLEQARSHYEIALRLNPEDKVAQSGLRRIQQQSAATDQR